MQDEAPRKRIKVSHCPVGISTKPFTEVSRHFVASQGRWNDREVVVTYTNSPDTVDTFLSTNDSKVFGFDLEHRPTYQKGQKANIAMIQLAPMSGDEVLIYSLFHNNGLLPDSLDCVLRDAGVLKYGVGVKGDCKHLAFMDLEPSSRASFKELGTLAHEVDGTISAGIGLKALVTSCLDKEVAGYKTKRLTMTNWEVRDLSAAQIKYAALDAWCGIEIWRHFTTLKEDKEGGR